MRSGRAQSIRRSLAALVLFAWAWLGIAAPFAHTCNAAGERHLPGISSSAQCAVCQWTVVEKTAEAAPAPLPEQPVDIQREFKDLQASYAFSSETFTSSRAPPHTA